MVTDWNPLTAWLWKQPYLRFAGKKYDSTITNRDQYMHLVNNSIVKHMAGFYEQNEELDTSGYMWFRQQYEEWLHTRYCKCEHHNTPFIAPPPYTCDTYGVRWEDVKFTEADSDDEEDVEEATSNLIPLPSEEFVATPAGPEVGGVSGDVHLVAHDPLTSPPVRGSQGSSAAKESGKAASPSKETDKVAPTGKPSKPCKDLWEECIKPQIRDIVLASLFCGADSSIDQRKNSHQLFGYDFMITEDDRPGKDGLPRVWLIEVNSSPAMDYSTRITTPLVKKCMEDLLKVIVDFPENPDADTGEFERLRHPLDDQCATRPRNHEKFELVGTAIEKPPWMKSKRRRERKETAE